MKNNQPITNHEIKMREGSAIVSRTDLKGMITYINQDFLDISGFSKVELIGKSHNIVRHPDMPSVVFQDLWDKMKAGEPWVCMVKNRCKNGDHYWVEANVTPVFKHGQISEYLSVRKIPTQEQINAAEALYPKLNAGTASLPKPNPLSSLFNIRNRIIGAYTLMSLLMLALGLNIFGSTTIGVMIAGIFTTVVLTVLTVYQILNPIKIMVQTIKDVQADPINTVVDFSMTDELGELQHSIKSLQVKVDYDIMRSKEKAEQAHRIREAFNNVSSNVMITDTSYDIIYMNKSVQTMFSDIEDDLKKELPEFNSKALLGTNIDVFHKNPSHQRDLLDNLTSTYQGTVDVGGRTLTLKVNPVVNLEGLRRGTVIEWSDSTAEVEVEQEVENIVGAGQQVDMTQRIELGNKSGFYKQLGTCINQLLDVVSDSFKNISDGMQALSDGNLTKNMEGDYSGDFAEIQSTINGTMSTLSGLVGNIRGSSGQISSAANEIFQGNTDLSQRTEEQAASLEETASSMEELTFTVKQNADNARQANQLSAGARDQAEEGGKSVGAAIEAMKEINQSSKKIEDIIGVIDEIAFQTNLLALNAAVEAARAGEQGKGFAVVASEVRSLAQRSAAAAKEIKSLIKDSVVNVDEGTHLVDDSGSMLGEIVTSVRKVSNIIAEIASSSSEQSVGIEQVNQAIAQLDEVTQQNAALVEEAAATSESMDEKAKDMNEMVGFFDIGKTPQVTSSASKPAPAPVASSTPKAAPVVKPVQTPIAVTDDDWNEF